MLFVSTLHTTPANYTVTIRADQLFYECSEAI
jgi:hypothetical protein